MCVLEWVAMSVAIAKKFYLQATAYTDIRKLVKYANLKRQKMQMMDMKVK